MTTSDTKHIPALDGIRGIAILLVICVHFTQLFHGQGNWFIVRLAQWGQTGVDLFFVLSGYLITRILLDSRESPHYLRNFFMRRLLRIFPLYYLALVAFYFVWPALGLLTWTPFSKSFWFWFDIQDFAISFAPSLQRGPDHFWSLAVEEHFYLIWPFVVLWARRRNLYKVIGGAILISLACRLALPNYDIFYFTFARLDGIAIGAALAVFLKDANQESLAKLTLWIKRVVPLAGLALILQLFLPRISLPVVHVLRNTLIAAVYACALLLVLRNQQTRAGKLLASASLRSVGKYSYAMYVIHPFLLTWLGHRGLQNSVLGLIEAMLVSYAAGWVSWIVLERPMLSLKRYFEASAPAPAPQPPSPKVMAAGV